MSFLRHRLLRITAGTLAGNSGGGIIGCSFDLSTASYDNVSFSVATEDTSPFTLNFNSDGTKMFILGGQATAIYQYTLSTGFNLSTASYDNVSFSVSSQDAGATSIAFSTDGTKMYMVGVQFDSVHQYTLSTGFNLSTASYDNVSFSVAAQEASPVSVTFSTDGTKMYITGFNTSPVHQYTLSTGFDISTASYDNVSFSVSSQETSNREITFSSDGTKMYLVGDTNDSIWQYTLTTGFDISTASYSNVSFSVSSQELDPDGIAFSNECTKMFIVGRANATVYQYSSA